LGRVERGCAVIMGAGELLTVLESLVENAKKNS